MMSDLIKRLRAFADGQEGTEHCLNDIDAAADKIEELEAIEDAYRDQCEVSDNWRLRATKAEAKIKELEAENIRLMDAVEMPVGDNPVCELGSYLADHLPDDQFNQAEVWLNGLVLHIKELESKLTELSDKWLSQNICISSNMLPVEVEGGTDICPEWRSVVKTRKKCADELKAMLEDEDE